MENVGIIVVTYNRLALLKEVIEALRMQSFRDFKIIIVNNGSTDETEAWLSSQKDLIVINQENVGGAGGFHSGMKYAAENNFAYCWIMDDDVICKPTALEELYNAYHKKEKIGFVCSKVIGINGEPMNTPVVDNRPTENGYADYSDLIEYQMIKVQKATFVSVFLSTSTIFEKGLPYREYFIWGDDFEYTQRISSSYSSYQACKSIVIHKRSIQASLSFDTESEPKRLKNYFYMFRNTGYNEFKYSIHSKKRHLRYYKNLIKKALVLFFKGETLKAFIILKATIALIRFKPKITYPQKSI